MKIQRLNMDNSWFFEFGGLRIVIDPWLTGKEIDFFSWFNTQWHRTKPIEIAKVPTYDLVLITQKYPDHFHKETLELINPKVVICPTSIKKKLQIILPQAEVQEFNQGIKRVLNTPVSVHHLPTSRKVDPIYDALILEDGKQSLFIATHGFTSIKEWEKVLSKLPPVELLLSPFDHYQLPFFLGGTVAPGIDGLRKLSNHLNPKYVIATHDEDKHASGLVSKFARITKSPVIEELQKYPELKNKIVEINHYKAVEL